jgi:NitT/TauT family transport system permease protein
MSSALNAATGVADAPSRRSAFAQSWAASLVAPVLVPAALLLFWHVATTNGWTRLIPTPFQTAEYMVDFLFGGIHDDAFSATAHIHLWASVTRVVLGFGLAAAVALPIGLMIGRIDIVRRMLDPLFQILRPIPVTAWLPLSMIIFGLGPRSAIALVFLAAFYPILLNTVFGVRNVDNKLFEAAAMLGCTGRAQFYRVVLPAALPSIFTGLRLGLGLAWFAIVVGEMTGVSQGLGVIIMDGRTLSRTELVICGMIIIGLAGFITDKLVIMLGRKLLRWNPNFNA